MKHIKIYKKSNVLYLAWGQVVPRRIVSFSKFRDKIPKL